MTKVGFYILADSAADSRLRLALRLTEKAFQRGHRIFIHCENESQAGELDDRLWTERPASFLPHVLLGSDSPEPSLAPPITLGWGQEPIDHDDLLINLQSSVPNFFSRFKRVAELVNQEPSRLQSLRDSYRFYRDRGYPLEQHKLGSI